MNETNLKSLFAALCNGELVFEVRVSLARAQEPCAPIVEVEDATECIILYVGRLHPSYVAPSWQACYEQLWRQILQLPSVSSQVYKLGKQRGTTFNRNLVANIIQLLAQQKVLTTDNATHLAMALEGDSRHSVRAQLGCKPPKDIQKEALQLIADLLVK